LRVREIARSSEQTVQRYGRDRTAEMNSLPRPKADERVRISAFEHKPEMICVVATHRIRDPIGKTRLEHIEIKTCQFATSRQELGQTLPLHQGYRSLNVGKRKTCCGFGEVIRSVSQLTRPF